MQKRLDKFLYQNGFARSRNQASELIKEGFVKVNKRVVQKPSFLVEKSDEVEILKSADISRAAKKLRGFLEDTSFIKNSICLDVGASTGGFTQVLLENGAKRVYALDVGKSQLDESLKLNPKVVNLEKTDIRDFKSDEKFDVVTCDVSFISIEKIIYDLDRLSKRDLIVLFKPQFEVGKDVKRDKRGVVLDKNAIKKAMENFEKIANSLNWRLFRKEESKVKGKEGNVEYFYHFKKYDIEDIAIGSFDGMHLGHKELFKRLSNRGGVVIIDRGNANITPDGYRCEYIDKPCFFYDLKEIKNLDAKGFIKRLKKDFPSLKKIVVGYDFAFGKDRKYSIDDLKKYFDGDVEVVDEVQKDGISIHSRVIREFIKNGDIKKANSLLGHNYKIEGRVIKGQGLGSKKLYPTINIEVKNFVLPKAGVYATLTDVNGIYEPSITFIGKRVSTDNNFAIETYVIDRDIQCPNKRVKIIFLDRIRDNKKFSSLDDLKNQIKKDIKRALEIVKEHNI